MRKKIISFLLTVVLIFCLGIEGFAVDISAFSAIVINTETHEIIFEKNAYEKRSMASTTKIMTSLLAIESGKLDETVTVDDKISGIEGTSIGLKSGYKIKLSDLVYAMLLESGNDAAVATAIFLSGSEKDFSKLMNKRAKQIGMNSTNFVTASGLDNEEHYTCAYDMALLGAFAVSNPIFRQMCSTKQYTFDFIKPEMRYTLSNHNRLLRTVDSVFGVKTGFTKKSGRCLVSAVERNGSNFIVVTLNAPDDWNDHKKLYAYIQDNVKAKQILPDVPKVVSVQGGTKSKLCVDVKSYNVAVLEEKDNINTKVFLPSFVYAPIKKGDVIGKYEIYYKDELIKTIDIKALDNIEAIQETYIKKKNIFDIIKEKLLRQHRRAHG